MPNLESDIVGQVERLPLRPSEASALLPLYEALERVFDGRGQIIIRSVHTTELRFAERLVVAPRDALTVQDIRQCDLPRIGHVRVPALAGIAQPNRFAGFISHVRQDHDLGEPGLMERIGHIDLKLAEAAAERGELSDAERLGRKAEDTVLAQGAQDGANISVRKPLRQISALDVGTEDLTAWNDLHDVKPYRFRGLGATYPRP
jgi:hypothetical protein